MWVEHRGNTIAICFDRHEIKTAEATLKALLGTTWGKEYLKREVPKWGKGADVVRTEIRKEENRAREAKRRETLLSLPPAPEASE